MVEILQITTRPDSQSSEQLHQTVHFLRLRRDRTRSVLIDTAAVGDDDCGYCDFAAGDGADGCDADTVKAHDDVCSDAAD